MKIRDVILGAFTVMSFTIFCGQDIYKALGFCFGWVVMGLFLSFLFKKYECK